MRQRIGEIEIATTGPGLVPIQAELQRWLADDPVAVGLLTALVQQRTSVPFDVIVVDSSSDDTSEIVTREFELQEISSRIQSQVADEVGKTQRQYYLREQMKAIQKELGEEDERTAEHEELRKKIEAAGMPEEARKVAEKELDRLSKMPPQAAEYTVSRTYLEGCKTREGIVTVKSGGRTTVIFTDAVLNMPKMGGLFGFLLGPTGHVSVPRIARMLIASDKRAFRAHLDRIASDGALSRLIFGHGRPLSEGHGDSLRAAASAIG